VATIPVLPTYAVGSRWTAARALEVKAAVDFHNNRPSASVSRVGTTFSLPHATNTAIQFDTEDFDTDGLATLGTSNDRLTIVTPGLYLVVAQVAFASNGTGNRAALLTRSGTVFARTLAGPAAGNAHAVQAQKLIRLVANDFLTVLGFQSSGAALNSDIGGGGCFLQATWIAA
jgi:hypothetical protein